MPSEVVKAIKQVCEDKGLAYETVLEATEASLAAAFRKDYGNKQQNVVMKYDPETGAMQAWDVKTVVEDMDVDAANAAFEEWVARKEAAKLKAVEEGKTEEEAQKSADDEFSASEPKRLNAKMEIMLADALKIDADAEIGKEIKIELTIPGEFGRMAAQTAKQVIMQKLREAERKTMYDEFKLKEGKLVTGLVQRRESRGVLIDFGKITGMIPPAEQISGERYIPGARIKVLLKSVEMGQRGPEIILSRSSPDFVRSVFEREIPEIASQKVSIVGIAREAGFRTKIAVKSEDDSVDPIGACIGQRGGRIQTIIAELGGEKVDVISYDEDPENYISNALAPAKVLRVALNNETKEAAVSVQGDQFSLAIGRGGQNVRLASNLTGWKIKVLEEGTGNTSTGEEAHEGAQEETMGGGAGESVVAESGAVTEGVIHEPEITSEVAEVETQPAVDIGPEIGNEM